MYENVKNENPLLMYSSRSCSLFLRKKFEIGGGGVFTIPK